MLRSHIVLVAAIFLNFVDTMIKYYDEVVIVLCGVGFHITNLKKLDIDLKNKEHPSAKPSIEELKHPSCNSECSIIVIFIFLKIRV